MNMVASEGVRTTVAPCPRAGAAPWLVIMYEPVRECDCEYERCILRDMFGVGAALVPAGELAVVAFRVDTAVVVVSQGGEGEVMVARVGSDEEVLEKLSKAVMEGRRGLGDVVVVVVEGGRGEEFGGRS